MGKFGDRVVLRAELRRRLKENYKDVEARLELASLLDSLGRKKEAAVERVKARQVERFAPDFDYEERREKVFGKTVTLKPCIHGEIVTYHWKDVPQLEYALPASVMQTALLASHIQENVGDILYADEHYPLLPQDLLKFLYVEYGKTPGEDDTTRAVGEEGFRIAHDSDCDMYTLLWP